MRSRADEPNLVPLGLLPTPVFAEVFILKVLKVLCFDTPSQVLILNTLH